METEHRIASPEPGLQLNLRHLPPARRDGPPRPVLYVHGATFPSGLSVAHRFDGYSWRDALCAAGFDVWGLDFLGFGGSDRYPAMREPAEANPPLGRAEAASRQVEAAARFILASQGAARLSLVAHSWGSMPTCRFAGREPGLVDRVVLFAPIARRQPAPGKLPPTLPAWRRISLQDQWTRFVEDLPPGHPPVLSRAHFDAWGEAYLNSDPDSRRAEPPAVKVPAGPAADIQQAWAGALAYDPALVTAPVAIIRGARDSLIPDQDARWLFDAFAASPEKRDIKISHGTHLMHLEARRFALYRESIACLTQSP